MPTTVICCSANQSRNRSGSPVVVANVLVSWRRRPRGSGTRTHAFRSALPISMPAHRSTKISTLITARIGPVSHGTVRAAAPARRTLSHVLEGNGQGRLSCGRSVRLRVGLEAPVWNDVTGPPPPRFSSVPGGPTRGAMIGYEGNRTSSCVCLENRERACMNPTCLLTANITQSVFESV